MPSPINTALLKLVRRAEQQDQEKLVSTFVDVGPLFSLLSSKDHQIVFGRRGTGKTHALKYLKQSTADAGDISIYIDLRTIGSNTSIYSDKGINLEERATRLLLDCTERIYNELFDIAIDTGHSEDRVLHLFEILGDQIRTIKVLGPIEKMTSQETCIDNNDQFGVSISVGKNSLSASADAKKRIEKKELMQTKVKESGNCYTRVSLGGLGKAISDIFNDIPFRRIWLLLDEWSTIPVELQPYLADLLRRAIFPLGIFVVKIGAIETRCNMYISQRDSDYIGIELGADVQADINLDDFMVFGNDSDKAETFFAELLRKHLVSEIPKGIDISTTSKFISKCFTQRSALVEFTRASEGVPRDAINIISLSAQKADMSKISVPNIRVASKTWYDRDKSNSINEDERDLLRWIVDNVIAKKKSRSFLLEHDKFSSDRLIRRLVDARILHILKRGYSAQDIAGVRFDVYGIDYGCYVDLLATAKAPVNSIIEKFSASISVPDDDYRSIRRAVLDLDEFYKNKKTM